MTTQNISSPRLSVTGRRRKRAYKKSLARKAVDRLQKNVNISYQAGWTDSFCHRRCMHEHRTLREAAACGSQYPCGWYVLAVENDTPRQLTEAEDAVVNKLRFGTEAEK